MKRKDGFVSHAEGKVWYEIVGDEQAIPLIVLHGGPGYPHDYLQPLEDLADDRQVIFYDQLGCGNSDITTDTSLWTLDHFVRELQQLIKELGVEKYHILGHSWGAALAVAFAHTKPAGLMSLILSDSYISTPHWVRDAQRLIGTLPEDMQAALKNKEEDPDGYKQARKEYYASFVMRLNDYPEPSALADKKMNRELYRYMWGAEEFQPDGTLSDLDLTSQLPEITVPVLLLCGRYDEATPESAQEFQQLLPNATLRVFENSAHFPFWSEREAYIQTIQEFLIS